MKEETLDSVLTIIELLFLITRRISRDFLRYACPKPLAIKIGGIRPRFHGC